MSPVIDGKKHRGYKCQFTNDHQGKLPLRVENDSSALDRWTGHCLESCRACRSCNLLFFFFFFFFWEKKQPVPWIVLSLDSTATMLMDRFTHYLCIRSGLVTWSAYGRALL